MSSRVAVPFHSRRWFLVAWVTSVASIGAWLATRPTEPPPAAQPIRCPMASASDRRVVVADLLSRGGVMPDCGNMLIETRMVFSDIYADSATLRVLVPCAELTRAGYAPTAGNADVLREGERYRLELSGPVADDRAGKNDPLWRAE